MSDFFRQILESLNVGILVFDAEGKLVYVNPAGEETLRGSARSLAGRHYRTLFRGSPEAVRIARRALASGAAVTAFDVSLRRPPGSGSAGAEEDPFLPVIVGASPLSGPSGEPGGAVLSIKSAEILALVGREERAAMSAQELQTLAYGIAHEIKNPLGGILGAAQWMLRPDTPAAEREEGTRLILREAGRINGLVEKMLDLGKRPPPSRPFSIHPLLAEAAALLLAEARGQGKEIHVALTSDPSLPDVSGHPDTVFRAIVNVLKNAVEAIDRRGTIRVEARINVNYRLGRGRARRRSFVEIAIADDGAGMTGEDLRKAFLPFYTTKPRGTGLGLVMARQAVSRLGGTMEIKSARGKGTTVRISLPVDGGRKPAP